MKKFKITKGNRVYIVDAKSHIDAISKVKAVKDSSIKDYSPEVYINELEKLIPQYQRLDELRHKIIESLENTNKINNDTWRKYDYLSDAKVKQYIKQVRELDKKWNSITSNLNRFNIDPYNQRLDVSDRDIWFDNLPDKSTVDSIKYAVERKAKKYKSSEDIWKDSISQWNPGMSEIGLFQISYKRNGVYQSILVRANSEEQAKQKLLNNLNGVDIIGVNSHPSPHFHEPILDSKIKDAWSGIRSNGVIFNYSNGKYTITHKNGKVETFPGNKFNTVEELFKYIDNIKDSKIKDSGINYGTLFIDLDSSNELTASRIVQELENEIGNNKIAEIRGGSFTPVSEHSDGRLDLDFKEFKNNEWGTNHITLMVRSSLPFLMKTMKDDPKYGAYKLRAELNSKLKQFANKTIYSNKSFTMDSAIKDMPLMFKSNVNMQSLKSNIDNVKNKPNETYINSLNANIQGVIADIEEIKGYEKEGKFNESPALKFSCKNLTAQYYKLLNDPKLQGTLHKLDVPTYKNVLYAEHQAQMLSQVTLKDSVIKDEDYSKYLSIVKQLEKLVEPANRELQQKIAKYGVTKQDIRNNSPKYRDVCREIPELKVWAKLIMQLPGELAGFMPAHPSQESVDKLKKAVTNSKAFDSTSAIKDEPIVFRNRVKPEDLVQSLRKSKTDSTFESVAIGNISEIIADFKADFANSKLDRIAVVSHYKEYRRNAEHWRDQVPATVRNKLDEMMRVIPA